MDYYRALDALLLPERCVLCRRRASVDVWCAACAAMMVPAHGCCYRCAGLRQAGHACWPDDAPVTATTTALLDSGPLRRSLATAAHHGAVRSWRAFAGLLARQYLVRDGAPTLVCAVPLTRRAQRIQPCNQRQLLAATFAALLALPMGPTFTLNRQRRQATHGNEAQVLHGWHIVLVTDVIFTGQSVWEAAQLLRAAGSKSVDVAAVTRRGEASLGLLNS